MSRLIAQLQELDEASHQRVVWRLTRLAPVAQEAVPVLARLLSDEKRGYSYEVAAALGAIGPDTAPTVPALVASLEQTQREVKIQYYDDERLKTLAKIGPAAKDALPFLLQLMNDPKLLPPAENAIRSSSELKFQELLMSAVVRIAPQSPKVAKTIRSRLKSEFQQLRAAACFELDRLAPNSPSLLNEIIAVLENDRKPSVRASAAAVIAGISGDRSAAVTPLIKALNDPFPDARRAATIALGSMNPPASGALPKLRQMWLDAFCGVDKPEPPIEPSSKPVTIIAMRYSKILSTPDSSMVQILLRAILAINPNSPVIP